MSPANKVFIPRHQVIELPGIRAKATTRGAALLPAARAEGPRTHSAVRPAEAASQCARVRGMSTEVSA